MSDTFYEESISKKHWTYDPICSAHCTQCWQRDMTWLSYQHQQRGARKGNELCLSCEGANLWLHTALQMSSRLKKQKMFVAQLTALSHHELAVLNSQHTPIQSTSGILTKTHALPTTIIPEFKQHKNDQKSLCVNKTMNFLFFKWSVQNESWQKLVGTRPQRPPQRNWRLWMM